MEDGNKWTASTLDSGGCLTLRQIVGSFSAPITEEHAWAVAYEAVKTLDNGINNSPLVSKLHLVSNLRHVLLHQDGYVAENTFVLSSNPYRGQRRTPITSENKALCELGLVIYTALDFGLGDDQERALSPELEAVLDLMTSADDSSSNNGSGTGGDEDEGIERDHHDEDGFKRSGVCKKILHQCGVHLSVGSEAQNHFRAVCHALVSEALELSNFMAKVQRNETETCEGMQELGLHDWARLWRQVLCDLRTGVKLKKLEYTKTPVEYELTPYEILMDDIRSRRYKLNKVMVDGELPQRMKKDAHDVVLQFIRSRPPLKPASERQLQPLRKESTPVELLMESIRNSSSRASLRKTGGPPSRNLVRLNSSNSSVESSRTKLIDDLDGNNGQFSSLNYTACNNRRRVTLDPSMVSDLLNFSDDESDVETEADPSSTGAVFPGQNSASKTPDAKYNNNNNNSENINGNNKHKKTWRKQLVLDLAMHGSPPASPTTSGAKGHRRRHSVTVCETPTRVEPRPKFYLPAEESPEKETRKPQKLILATQMSTISSQSNASSGTTTPNSEQENPSSIQHEPDDVTVPKASMPLSVAQMHASLHAEFLMSEHWATALQTLDLTLDEVVHIRSVLTKAELEGLPLDGTLKEDMERGKVCFLCMKTRFGFFSRGYKCELCCRQICQKCSTKMRIPLEHFSTTPVITLSPNVVTNDGTRDHKSFRERMTSLVSGGSRINGSGNSAGSAPTSPALRRKKNHSLIDDLSESGHVAPNLSVNQLMTSSLTSFSRTEVDEEYDEHYGAQSLNYDMNEEPGHSGPVSLPPARNYFGRLNAKKSAREKLEGSLLTICMDCKEMVLQVVRAQSTARRLQMAKSLFLTENA